MTKKVTGNDLKALIMEVLAEAEADTDKEKLKKILDHAIEFKKTAQAKLAKYIRNKAKELAFTVTTSQSLNIALWAKKNGSLDPDLQTILDSDEPKKDEPKKDEPKKDEPKKDEPKKDDGDPSKFYPFSVKGDARGIKKAWTDTTGDASKIADLRDYAKLANDGTDDTIDQSDITSTKGRAEPALQKLAVKQAFDLITTLVGPKSTGPLGFEKDRLKTDSQFSIAIDAVPKNVQDAILRNFNKTLGDTAIADIAGLAETKILKELKTALDWEDFSVILQNPEHPLFKPALRTLKQLKNLRDPSEFTKGLGGLVGNLRGEIDTADVSSEETFSSLPSVDVADLHGASRKSVPSYVVDVFNALDLGAIPTLVGRINKISEISGKILGATDASGDLQARTTKTGFETKDASLGELMATLGVMDSIQKIAKKMDDKASGWAFESFLAQLVNGTTEGTDYGAGDFAFGLGVNDPIPTGVGGSAKFVQKKSVTQALSTSVATTKGGQKSLGPLGKTNGTLTYIVGVKRIQEKGEASYRSGVVKSPEFSQMNAIDIHILYLKQTGSPKVSDDGTITHFNPKDIKADGVTVSLGGEKNTTLNYDFKKQDPVATLYIADDEGTFQDLGKQALNKFDETMPKLIQNINIFSKRTSSYLTAGGVDDIEKALDAYTNLYAQINKSFGVDSEYSKETGITSGVTGGDSLKRADTKAATKAFTEQKITSNFLKKLISESFKR